MQLWDLRSDRAVQKFDAVVCGRHQCGLALSPCLQYLAAGTEDGTVVLYDTRRLGGWLARLPSQSSSPVTSVAFNPAKPGLLAATLEGELHWWD